MFCLSRIKVNRSARGDKMENTKTKNWKLDTTDGWYIVLDNGGGLTLCVTNKYQHNYDDASQLATDIISLELNGLDSVSEWDGNQLCLCNDADKNMQDGVCNACDGFDMLDPDYNQINNGGYHIIESIGNLLSTDDDNIWGGNGLDLKKSLQQKMG